MSKRYQRVLSTLKVGSKVLKTRLVFPSAGIHYLQGNEEFPADPLITFYANLAKNEAGLVTITAGNPVLPKGQPGDRWVRYDLEDCRVANYMSHHIDTIHFYGAKVTVPFYMRPPQGTLFSPAPPPPPSLKRMRPPGGPMGKLEVLPTLADLPDPSKCKVVNEKQMDEMIGELVGKLELWKYFGLDAVSVRIENFLSPLSNLRTDKYGGSLENRARFPLRMCQRIKEAYGEDLLVEIIITAGLDATASIGINLAESVEFAKLADKAGTVDILTLRAIGGGESHYLNRPEGPVEMLAVAEAIKKSGVKLAVGVNGTIQDPDLMEDILATGKADLIGVGRGFICDYELGKKLREGRGEDVVPCVMCNSCHNYGGDYGPSIHVCPVNPIAGLQHKIGRMVEPPARKKKVAIVGGGPAGMEAALVAADRGHEVTLFEQKAFLGGQLVHADHADFKWTYKRFKEYLIRQVYKAGIKVYLNTEATPDKIKQGGFDAVIAALGAVPKLPDIPGAQNAGVWFVQDVYGREKELGKNVVVIGGAVKGTEVGVYLAQAGHKVTVLTRERELCHGALHVHYIIDNYTVIVKGGYDVGGSFWDGVDGFSFITNATTTVLAKGKVTYVDAAGGEHVIKTDSIVISGGMTAKQDEALEFSSAAEEYYMVGDCEKAKDVAMAIRTAFNAAVRL